MRSALLGPVFAATLAAVVAFPSPADATLGNARDGAVTFFAKGPAGLKIEGKTSEISVSEKDGKVSFVVPLGNLDTGIGLRNKHMREKYLETAKYPNAELVVERSALRFAEDGKESAGTAPGTMTIHGKTRPVTVTYKARRSGNSYQVDGGVALDMNQFGIEVPSYAGVTVKPDIDIVVRTKVED